MSKRFAIITVAILVVILGAGAALEATGVINLIDNKKPEQSTGQQTKGEPVHPSSSSQPNDSSSSVSPSLDQKSGANAGSSAKLVTPLGNFVSNHSPNLSGKPAPNTEQSVCNTTPGAKCQITFTKGSVVKSLPLMSTDSNGAAFWSWKLQDYGFTVGGWVITAKATLGTQAKTSTDALKLNVGP